MTAPINFSPRTDLLATCVQQIENLPHSFDISIRGYELFDPVPAKTNNTSKVQKMRIEFTNGSQNCRKVSVIVKIPYGSSNDCWEVCKMLHFYDKEAIVYEKVMPRIHELLGSEIAPIMYTSDEQHVLFLEDLSERGYRVQLDGQLDAEHCMVAVQQLARLHAASHVLDKEQPGAICELVKRQLFVQELSLTRPLGELKPFLKALFRRHSLSEESLVQFFTAVEKASTVIVSSMESCRFQFNVLNHGDMKVHNLLFQQLGKEVNGCRIIDFQGCRWSSPALDVFMFAIMAMDFSVYANSFDEILQKYLLTLNATLKMMNYESAYTKADFLIDLGNINAFKLHCLLFTAQIDVRELINDIDYSVFLVPSEERIEKVCSDRKFLQKFLFWFGEFEKSGVFENFCD